MRRHRGRDGSKNGHETQYWFIICPPLSLSLPPQADRPTSLRCPKTNLSQKFSIKTKRNEKILLRHCVCVCVNERRPSELEHSNSSRYKVQKKKERKKEKKKKKVRVASRTTLCSTSAHRSSSSIHSYARTSCGNICRASARQLIFNSPIPLGDCLLT